MAELHRPTEGQLRWAQFHHKRRAVAVRRKIEELYQFPKSIDDVEEALPDDDADSRSNYPPISRGRKALLKVSQRNYEKRKQFIVENGYRDDQDNDDAVSLIFAEGTTNPLHKRKNKRYAAAMNALLQRLEKLKESHELPVCNRRWSRPVGEKRMTMDGREYMDLRWGVFNDQIKQQLKDVAVQYLNDHNSDDLDDDVATLIDHVEKAFYDNNRVAAIVEQLEMDIESNPSLWVDGKLHKAKFAELLQSYLEQANPDRTVHIRDLDVIWNRDELDRHQLERLVSTVLSDGSSVALGREEKSSFLESFRHLSVTNKVGELFRNLKAAVDQDHEKTMMDQASGTDHQLLSQFKKRVSIESEQDHDRSSVSSFRVLPKLRNVVMGFRKPNLSPRYEDGGYDSEHKSCDFAPPEADEESYYNDEESIIDESKIPKDLMANLMLSPTLITKRLHQAIRAIETSQWDQLSFLITANPWLAEMADIRTNQYLLHKLAFFGAGELTQGNIRQAPAPEQINHDLIKLFTNSVFKIDKDGNLPLHMACASGNYVMIQLLGEKFSSAASVRNEVGMLPLHLIILACAEPLVSLLLYPDLSVVSLVKMVLDLFPGAVSIADNNGNLPIHTAAGVLKGAVGFDVVELLIRETNLQVDNGLRFSKPQMSIEDEDQTVVTLTTEDEDEEDDNCRLVRNEQGYTPLALAIYGNAGWDVVEKLTCESGGLQGLDEDENTALHLLVSSHADPAAALAVLRIVPEAAAVRNENGMLPVEGMPREVILALALVDLPINLDEKSDTTLRDGFGASWWYITCDCDDHYLDVVEEVVSLCSFDQVQALCSLKKGRDTLLRRATPKSRSVLSKLTRFVGRFEFTDNIRLAPSNDDFLSLEALDYGTSWDPIPHGRNIILQVFSRKSLFEQETAILEDVVLDVNSFEEILTFTVSQDELQRSPLSSDSSRRYFVMLELPDLTLNGVVRGMLNNEDCQNNMDVRHRYNIKVFSVLRLVAKALRRLHEKGYIHGNVCLENCGKYEDRWKLSEILGVQQIGVPIAKSRLSTSAPPEAVHGNEHLVQYRSHLVANESFDSWSFGKLAFEVLVGKPLIDFSSSHSGENRQSLVDLLRWDDHSIGHACERLDDAGIVDSGVELIADCLSYEDERRPTMDEILRHSVWDDLRATANVGQERGDSRKMLV